MKTTKLGAPHLLFDEDPTTQEAQAARAANPLDAPDDKAGGGDTETADPESIPSLAPGSLSWMQKTQWPGTPGPTATVGSKLDAPQEGDDFDPNQPVPTDPAERDVYIAKMRAALLKRLGAGTQAEAEKAVLAAADRTLAPTPRRSILRDPSKPVPWLGARATADDARGTTGIYDWSNPSSPGNRPSGAPYEPLPVQVRAGTPMTKSTFTRGDDYGETLYAAATSELQAAGGGITHEAAIQRAMSSDPTTWGSVDTDTAQKARATALARMASNTAVPMAERLPGVGAVGAYASKTSPDTPRYGSAGYTHAQPWHAEVAAMVGADESVALVEAIARSEKLDMSRKSDRSHACRLFSERHGLRVDNAPTLESAVVAWITRERRDFSDKSKHEATVALIKERPDLCGGQYIRERDARRQAVLRFDESDPNNAFAANVQRFKEQGLDETTAIKRAQALLVPPQYGRGCG